MSDHVCMVSGQRKTALAQNAEAAGGGPWNRRRVLVVVVQYVRVEFGGGVCGVEHGCHDVPVQQRSAKESPCIEMLTVKPATAVCSYSSRICASLSQRRSCNNDV